MYSPSYSYPLGAPYDSFAAGTDYTQGFERGFDHGPSRQEYGYDQGYKPHKFGQELDHFFHKSGHGSGRHEEGHGYGQRYGYGSGSAGRDQRHHHGFDQDHEFGHRTGGSMGGVFDASKYGKPKLPKLYVAKISANCLGPWLLLKEAGIPFELVEVDLAKGDNHTHEFLAMNPMGQVPTYVETDGTVIWESNAIMRFICEKHAVPKHFYPRDVNLRGRIEMALDWRQTVLYPNMSKLCYPALGFTKDKSRVTEGRESLEKDLRILSEFFLRETPFIGGALPCIADYAIGLPLLYLYATDFRIPPKVREYLENLAGKTPAWNEVTEELKKFISHL